MTDDMGLQFTVMNSKGMATNIGNEIINRYKDVKLFDVF